MLELHVDRLRFEPVHGEPVRLRHRDHQPRARHPMSRAQNRPAPWRHLPLQFSLRRDLRGQIHDLARRHGPVVLRGIPRCQGRPHHVARPHEIARVPPVGFRRQHFRPLTVKPRRGLVGIGKCHDARVAVIELLQRQIDVVFEPRWIEHVVVAVAIARQRQHARKRLRPHHAQARLEKPPAGILRRDPRPAHRPTGTQVDADFEFQPRRLAHRVPIEFAPLRREKRRALRHLHAPESACREYEQHAAHAFCAKLLEVAGDARPVNEPVEPPPVARRLHRIGHRDKSAAQSGQRRAACNRTRRPRNGRDPIATEERDMSARERAKLDEIASRKMHEEKVEK